MRPNTIAPWELHIGDLYYEIKNNLTAEKP
jgi:hypothetical protein